MTSYSIAEANSRLAQIVREAESGKPVELTRRGQPVVVLLSAHEYARLKQPKMDFWSAYLKWRSETDWSDITNEDVERMFEGLRDKSPGRDFKFEE